MASRLRLAAETVMRSTLSSQEPEAFPMDLGQLAALAGVPGRVLDSQNSDHASLTRIGPGRKLIGYVKDWQT